MTPAEIQAALAAPMVFNVRASRTFERDGGWHTEALAYLDRGDVQKRLDAVMGIDGWKAEMRVIDPDKGTVQCSLSLKIGDAWITKEDVGSPGNSDEDNRLKGGASDAFKRAATMWGIGRFLYEMPRTSLPVVVRKDKAGKERFSRFAGADPVAAMLDRAKRAGVPWALTYDHKAPEAEPAEERPVVAADTPARSTTSPELPLTTPTLEDLKSLMAELALDQARVATLSKRMFRKVPSRLESGQLTKLIASLRNGGGAEAGAPA